MQTVKNLSLLLRSGLRLRKVLKVKKKSAEFVQRRADIWIAAHQGRFISIKAVSVTFQWAIRAIQGVSGGFEGRFKRLEAFHWVSGSFMSSSRFLLVLGAFDSISGVYQVRFMGFRGHFMRFKGFQGFWIIYDDFKGIAKVSGEFRNISGQGHIRGISGTPLLQRDFRSTSNG